MTTESTATATSTPPILTGLQSALPSPLLSKILTSRILLIGSGGIGCELLKNLALSGFRHVEVVDLDTIDVSNLNRQFLFRARHVGMPKCKVASEAALAMVPPYSSPDGNNSNSNEAAYIPHHGNVLDNSKFNVPYLQQFALVLNALDNITARRRVNRLCLAAGIPLIEAGTAGYLGQVTVIHKSAGVECYECQVKATQKVYPICTIRSTPSMPVHCVVWGKELYKLCFGGKVEESMLFEDEESLRAEKEGAAEEADAEGKTDTEKSTDVSTNNMESAGEKSTYMDQVHNLRALMDIGNDVPQSKDEHHESNLRIAAKEALTALFATEINKQIGMNRYKTAEKVPVPISSQDLDTCTNVDGIPPTQRADYAPTEIWTPADCLVEMVSCFIHVSNASSPPLPEFDKDDEMAMRFVTAACNLRQYVFQIEPNQSLYDAKGIAGNIIPAIATTNAIVAGLQVLQAFHILKCQLEFGDNKEEVGAGIKKACRYTYCLREKTRKGYLLQPTQLPAPNPNCFVCRNAIISLALNTKEWTLEMLLARVIKKELGFGAPTVLVGGDIVYEEGDDIDPEEYAANLPKKLVDLPSGGVGHGAVFGVEDFSQDLEVEISVTHKDEWFITVEGDDGAKKEVKPDDREESEKFEIGGKKPVAAAPTKSAADGVSSEKDKTDSKDDDSIEVMDVEPVDKPSVTDGNSNNAADDADSDIEVIEVSTPRPAAASAANGSLSPSRVPLKKRRLDWDRDDQNVDEAKKSKTDEGVEVIEIE
ncbi:hypothetical protein ACHAXN_003439 [Cyclotella atomus]